MTREDRAKVLEVLRSSQLRELEEKGFLVISNRFLEDVYAGVSELLERQRVIAGDEPGPVPAPAAPAAAPAASLPAIPGMRVVLLGGKQLDQKKMNRLGRIVVEELTREPLSCAEACGALVIALLLLGEVPGNPDPVELAATVYGSTRGHVQRRSS